jgi:type I restriction enzyme S subunit
MTNEWSKTTIGEQATLQRGFDITRVEQRDGRIPVISSGGVSSYHDQAAVRGPGVVLGRKGVVGSVFYMANDYWPHDTTLWVKDFHGNVPRFVYYFFKYFAPRLATMDVGSANPTLNRNHVHPLGTLWPPVDEQQAIASILGTLDDKIELNWRMNETLEGIARAIFKSWFVDFDPVLAKADGRETGLPEHISALFSDGFEQSELGQIPLGWRTRAVWECAEYINGLAFRNEHFSPAGRGLPIIKIAELKEGVTRQTKFTEQIFDPKYSVTSGDVLFSWSGSPDTSIDTFLWVGMNGWLNQHIFKILFFRPEERTFVYYLLKELKSIFVEIARNKQTTGLGHVTAEDLKRERCVWPPDPIILAYARIIEPLFQKNYKNRFQSITLAAVRDSLLPRLISGELLIPHTEAIIGRLL